MGIGDLRLRKAAALLGLKAADPTPPEVALLGHISALVEEANARRSGVLGEAHDVAVLARWTGDAERFCRALAECGVGSGVPFLRQRTAGTFEVVAFWAEHATETALKTRLKNAAEEAVGKARADVAQGYLRAALRAGVYDLDSAAGAEVVATIDRLLAERAIDRVDAESLRGAWPVDDRIIPKFSEKPAPLDLREREREREGERDSKRSSRASAPAEQTARQRWIETIRLAFAAIDQEAALAGKYPAISKALSAAEQRLGQNAERTIAELLGRIDLSRAAEPVAYLIKCLASLKATPVKPARVGRQDLMAFEEPT